jgi:nucleoside phosphorylase
VVRTLIVSAWEPEIAPLRAWLRARRGAARAMLVLDTVGVGVVDAGIATARLVARARPRRILFVGTAGAYGAAPAIDAAVVVARAQLISTAALRGDGYLPPPLAMAATISAQPAWTRALGRFASGRATAANPLGITRAAALARRIARDAAATVENLELFAVGRAAALAGLPFAAVVGIANRVGPRAHVEWKRHHLGASAAACTVVTRWLEQSWR